MRYIQTLSCRCLSLAVLAGVWIVHAASAAELRFTAPESNSVSSDDGTIQLSWEWASEAPPGERIYEVTRSSSSNKSDPVVVYQGRDTATFVSGLSEGEYFFRVNSRSANGGSEASSRQVKLTVEYIDGELVVILMTAGLITFLAIVLAIAIGHMKTRKELEANL